jgi:hypothetical protein
MAEGRVVLLSAFSIYTFMNVLKHPAVAVFIICKNCVIIYLNYY